MGPLKFTTARPISAPYSSCSLRIDSGEPSKPERLARITTGRLLLAALMARATFLEDMREQRSGAPLLRPIGRHESESRYRPRLYSDAGIRDSRRDGHPKRRRFRRPHAGPTLQGRMILIDDRHHHPANVEGLLASGIGFVGEDLADPGEALVAALGMRIQSGRRGRRDLWSAARRGNRSPGKT